MDFFKINLYIILIVFISVLSCKEPHGITIRRIPLPVDNYCFPERGCMDAYSIEGMIFFDINNIDTVNKFVLENYDKIKVASYNDYSIEFYEHNADEFEIISKDNNELNKRSIKMKNLMYYRWINGIFEGVTIYFDGKPQLRQPVQELNVTNIKKD